MKDFDGNDCIDYAGSWGPTIIGHNADDENVLAEMVIKAVPSIEMVRFVNSGTEACMGVRRLSSLRAVTMATLIHSLGPPLTPLVS
ncbi:hypothetical protein OIU84_001434 [Salix udensis]|uniref:Uncharacterized protein n=1 Tax=Salix udensis TaxID=889485 RepID=A0AAD6K705_9ROSI|nr:hypothetical protein OIU84_001434 [Salix udensis]